MRLEENIPGNPEIVKEIETILTERIPDDHKLKYELYKKLREALDKALQHNDILIDQFIQKIKPDILVEPCEYCIYLDREFNETIDKAFKRLMEIYHPYN